jgi:LysM repeat protein
MPITHTVQQGDTLSQIGQKYGVDYKNITGFRSGNPDLIFPGEVLNIPSNDISQGVSPTPVLPTPTPTNTGFDTSGIDTYKDPLDQYIPDYLKEQQDAANAKVSFADERQRFITQYQDRINALNQIYDRQLAQVQQEGKGRVGQGTAILARRGLGGSARGGAIQENILSQNRGIEQSVEDKRQIAIMGVYDKIDEMAFKEAELKQKAKEKGAEFIIEHIKTKQERQEKSASEIASQIVGSGFKLEEMDTQTINDILDKLKITPLQLRTAYSNAVVSKAKAEFEMEGELLKRDKTKAEITEIDTKLKQADKKFEEDKRQFGLEYALKEREQSLKELKQASDLKGVKGDFKSVVATQGRQAVSNMLNIAMSNQGIFGASAALPLPDFARSDAYRNYKAQLDFLKGNIIPAALTAMREASKTGGALGQISDREGAWLGASLGALDMSQSPDMVINQLRQIDASLTRWQNAVSQYGGSSGSSDEEQQLRDAGYSEEQIQSLKSK